MCSILNEAPAQDVKSTVYQFVLQTLDELAPGLVCAMQAISNTLSLVDGEVSSASRRSLFEDLPSDVSLSACREIVLRLALHVAQRQQQQQHKPIKDEDVALHHVRTMPFFASSCSSTASGTSLLEQTTLPAVVDGKPSSSMTANPFMIKSPPKSWEASQASIASSRPCDEIHVDIKEESSCQVGSHYYYGRHVARMSEREEETAEDGDLKRICGLLSLVSMSSETSQSLQSLRPLGSFLTDEDLSPPESVGGDTRSQTSTTSSSERRKSSSASSKSTLMMLPPVFTSSYITGPEERSMVSSYGGGTLPIFSKSFISVLKTSKTHLVEDDDDEVVQINDYTILGEAGRGNFGVVKIAVKEQELSTDSNAAVYAIKIVKKKKLNRQGLRRSSSPSLSYVHAESSGESHGMKVPISPKMPSSPQNQGAPRRPSAFTSSGDKSPPAATRKITRTDGPAWDSVRREMEVMKLLRHPNIVGLHEIIDDPADPNLYLVMPYCDRGPMLVLSQAGTCKPFDVDVARGYMRQIMAGLAYLHSKHVAHMDIKPDNILLDSSHTCYLSDFGTSELFAQKDDAVHVFRGTPSFAAPEALASAHYDPFRADMWALGVTFYAMLYGHLPFRGQTLQELVSNIIAATTKPLTLSSPPPEGHDHHQNDAAMNLLAKLLAPDPLARPTAAEAQRHYFFGPKSSAAL